MPSRKSEAFWLSAASGADSRSPLRVFDPIDHGRLIHDKLGIYPDADLGTPYP